ncbi:proline--tRNA ligase [Planctomycetota bacterium]
MAGKQKTAITPTREEDYPEWYQQVIKAADLADNSPVRGCMVIKPWGYAIWENIKKELDRRFKETGHENAYFPLFIPMSFLQKEAEHVEGFAKECAVVTHHRLEESEDGTLVPAGELAEPMVVRPTSETIIGAMFAKWVQSYRDLPLLINQWANIVRWEMRTRMFLRTTEFLWQEGHTVHATEEEAREETLKMLNVYSDFAEKYMAIPVIKGEKTEAERFPGAVETFSIECMMQDRKALQSGTSHFLGQNFARSSEIKFQTAQGEEKYAWTTSWGVSTRLIGGLIMAHSDDDGLILPPRIAPQHVVIMPVVRDESTKNEVFQYCSKLAAELSNVMFSGEHLHVKFDDSEGRAGDKIWSWVKKGVPIRLEVGPREIEEDSVFVAHRNKGKKERFQQKRSTFISGVTKQLESIQNELFQKALKFQKEHTCIIDSKDEFIEFFSPADKEKPEIHGGFALSHWCGDSAVEEQIKDELNVTIRCIPLDREEEEGSCIYSGKPSRGRVLFAKAY